MQNSETHPTTALGYSTKEEIAARMQQVVDHYEKGNRRAFAKNIEANDGAIVYFLPGGSGRKGYPGFEIIAKVLARYPEISAEWLVRGIGKMLDRKSSVFNDAEKKKMDDKLVKAEAEARKWEDMFHKLFEKSLGQK